MKRKPVPWLYTENGIYKNWTWETKHFTVKVIGEGDLTSGGAVFTWQILEKDDKGSSFIFETSTNRSFREAELEIVETISKSWDKKLGYDEYAGSLATTFTIAGDTKLDVEEFVGHNVELSVREHAEPLRGVFGLKHYDFILKQSGGQVKVVPPLTVTNIKVL
jgi:hypothetical protein